MLRVGICDDEPNARDSLRWMLEKLDCFDRGEGEVIYEFTGGEGAVRWLKNHKGELDLLFLDVEMGGMNGVEAARRIRAFDRHILLVFLTGYPDFVFDGYQVEALDYLIKPVKPEILDRVISRAIERLQSEGPGGSGEGPFVVLKNMDGMFRIYKEDLVYCYSQGRQVFVVLSDGRELAFYRKLDEMGELLGRRFVRTHQRYLVNSDFVEMVGRDQIRLRLGKEREEGFDEVLIPMSRAMREQATARLARNLIGV